MTERTNEAAVEREALVPIVRPSGVAMFHAQDCAHVKRAISGLYVTPEDFSPGDVWCSACRPDAHPNPEPPTGDGGREGVGRRG